jgi:hypothetical protein
MRKIAVIVLLFVAVFATAQTPRQHAELNFGLDMMAVTLDELYNLYYHGASDNEIYAKWQEVEDLLAIIDTYNTFTWTEAENYKVEHLNARLKWISIEQQKRGR